MFESLDLRTSLDFVQLFVCALSAVAFAVLVYVVLTASPSKIAVYKVYLIVNATLGFLVQLGLAIVHLDPFLPKPVFSLRGLIDIYIALFGIVSKRYLQS